MTPLVEYGSLHDSCAVMSPTKAVKLSTLPGATIKNKYNQYYVHYNSRH